MARSEPTTGDQYLTTGAFARRAGVHVETVRYYERRGLLPEPPRTDAGHRRWGPDAVRRLRFIRRAQELGFTLDEIGELLDLALSSDDAETCANVEDQARAALVRVERDLADLGRMRVVLRSLLEACERRSPTEACPILRTIEEERG